MPGEEAALIGLDAGDFTHSVAMAVRGSIRPPEVLELEHSAENFHQWLEGLRQRFKGAAVAIAIEGAPGGVLAALWEHVGWLRVYSVHPASSSGMRRVSRPSGAKSDTIDAKLILSLLQQHREDLHPLFVPARQDELLRHLTKDRRRLVGQRSALTNRLKSLLKKYFPQALELAGTLHYSALTRDFLTLWPDLEALQSAPQETIAEFYRSHHVTRAVLTRRLELIAAARPLTTNPALMEGCRCQLACLLDQIAAVQKHIVFYEERIAEAFEQHPDHQIFKSLPGAGAALAPRLAAALTSDRSRFATAGCLQRFTGIAPITKKSGRSEIVCRRRGRPEFLHQAFIEWAGQTVAACPWSRAYYFQQRDKGKRHWEILRSLAFKWMNILWKCWQTRTPYDEARYLNALKKQNSPLVAVLKPITKKQKNTQTSLAP